jgi:hypothetical protein
MYGIVPPGLEPKVENFYREGTDKAVLFDTLTAAVKYIESLPVANKFLFKIVYVSLSIEKIITR